MFRKIAIALVAASVFAAPVLAQTPSIDNKVSPSAPTAGETVKTNKSITKHRVALRHHRHGTKMVKYAKFGKYTRHMKHGGTSFKQTSGAQASVKPVSPKLKGKLKAKSHID
jgi:hypothetical protein